MSSSSMRFPLSWLLLAFAAGACSAPGGGKCKLDNDCSPGFVCVSGICYQTHPDGSDGADGADGQDGFDADGGDPNGDDGGLTDGDDGGGFDGDDGGVADGDPGGDDGGIQDGDGDDPDGGDQAPAWTIVPGSGIGPVLVSQSLDSFHTLADAQAWAGEAGQNTEAAFTHSFLGGSLLVAGIDVNGNGVFDGPDHLLSVTAKAGLDAATAEGVAVGDTRADVRAVWPNPDYAADVPPYGDYPGGKVDDYFGEGIYFGYDTGGVIDTIAVSRPYLPPDALIQPSQGALSFNGVQIVAGDGYNTGSVRTVHRNLLGEPDWASGFTSSITTDNGTTDIDFYADAYRIQGIEIVGGDDTVFFVDIDRVVIIALHALFYGQTAAGHGIGSTRAEWESELGPPAEITSDPEYGKTYIYTTGSRAMAVVYDNDGNAMSDVSLSLILNYQVP